MGDVVLRHLNGSARCFATTLRIITTAPPRSGQVRITSNNRRLRHVGPRHAMDQAPHAIAPKMIRRRSVQVTSVTAQLGRWSAELSGRLSVASLYHLPFPRYAAPRMGRWAAGALLLPQRASSERHSSTNIIAILA